GRGYVGLDLLVPGWVARIGWLGRGAVAGQVDRDRLPAAVGEQVEPARVPPVVFGRGGEAVHEQDRRILALRHAPRDRLSSAVAFSMSDWCLSSTCRVPMTRSVLISSVPSRNSVRAQSMLSDTDGRFFSSSWRRDRTTPAICAASATSRPGTRLSTIS